MPPLEGGAGGGGCFLLNLSSASKLPLPTLPRAGGAAAAAEEAFLAAVSGSPMEKRSAAWRAARAPRSLTMER